MIEGCTICSDRFLNGFFLQESVAVRVGLKLLYDCRRSWLKMCLACPPVATCCDFLRDTHSSSFAMAATVVLTVTPIDDALQVTNRAGEIVMSEREAETPAAELKQTSPRSSTRRTAQSSS